MNLSQLSLSGIDINIGRSVGVGAFVGEGKVEYGIDNLIGVWGRGRGLGWVEELVCWLNWWKEK